VSDEAADTVIDPDNFAAAVVVVFDELDELPQAAAARAMAVRDKAPTHRGHDWVTVLTLLMSTFLMPVGPPP
jgi:hypothetical protein